jgi:hypothetical protein
MIVDDVSRGVFILIGVTIVTLGLYVVLLRDGTRLLHRRNTRFWGFVVITLGMMVHGIGIGLVLTISWLLIKGELEPSIFFALASGTGVLIATAYVAHHERTEPKRHTTP